MESSKLKNKFLKNKSKEIKVLYVKHRNYFVFFLKKSKKEYSKHLNEKSVFDNKNFWKTVKSALSDKVFEK